MESELVRATTIPASPATRVSTSEEDDEHTAKQLTIHLKDLATEIRDFCATEFPDYAEMHAAMDRLTRHLRTLANLIPVHRQQFFVGMRQALWKEQTKWEQTVLGGTQEQVDARKLKEMLHGSIIALAVELKYYRRAKSQVAEDPSEVTAASAQPTIGSPLMETTRRTSTMSTNPHHQLNLDILSFVRECTAFSASLKQRPPATQNLDAHLRACLLFLRNMQADATLQRVMDDDTLKRFQETVDTLAKHEHARGIFATTALEEIQQALQQSVSIIKVVTLAVRRSSTAHPIHDAAPPPMPSFGGPGTATGRLRSTSLLNSSQKNASPAFLSAPSLPPVEEPVEDNDSHQGPLNYQHNTLMFEPEDIELQPEDVANPLPTPIAAASLATPPKSTATVTTNPSASSAPATPRLPASMKRVGSTGNVILSRSTTQSSSILPSLIANQLQSQSQEDGGNAGSNPNLRRTMPPLGGHRAQNLRSNVLSLTLSSIGQASVYLAAGELSLSKGKYILTLDAQILDKKMGSSTLQRMTKTDAELRALSKELQAQHPNVPGTTPRFQSSLTVLPNAVEMANVNEDATKMLEWINTQPVLLASEALHRFVRPEEHGDPSLSPNFRITANAGSGAEGSTMQMPPSSARPSETGKSRFFNFLSNRFGNGGKAQSLDTLPNSNDSGVSSFARRRRRSSTRGGGGDDGGNAPESADPTFEAFCKEMEPYGYTRVGDQLILYDTPGSPQEQLIFKNQNGFPHIVAGTPEKLFQLLVSDHFHERNYKKCFLLTYRTFMLPAELLMKVIATFKAVRQAWTTDTAKNTQLPLTRFVQYWIERHFEDFEGNAYLLGIMDKFLTFIERSEKLTEHGREIRETFEEQRTRPKPVRVISYANLNPDSIITNVGAAEFLSLQPDAVARQITRVDNEIFHKIKPLDFIAHIWEKKGPEVKEMTPIEEWTQRFNQISYWVATEVATTPILKNRIAVVEKMIKVLKHLKELNNYNGMMAVIAGLNLSSMRRLKKTWNGVSGKQMSVLHEMEKVMSPEHNYSNYRELESKRKNQPFIPFPGLYLKDLTFSNDGNAKTLPNGLVNFGKAWGVFEIVERIYQFQTFSYAIEEEKETTEYCKKLIALPEKRLYKYSLLCEPREAEDGGSGSGAAATSKVRLLEKWANESK